MVKNSIKLNMSFLGKVTKLKGQNLLNSLKEYENNQSFMMQPTIKTIYI